MSFRGEEGNTNMQVVRLRGLPFNVMLWDISGFVESPTVDILICYHNGRKTGDAYVVLSNAYDVDKVLSKDRTYLGNRYVEVFHATKLDYYKAVHQEVSENIYNDRFSRDKFPYENQQDHRGGAGSRGMGGGYRQNDNNFRQGVSYIAQGQRARPRQKRSLSPDYNRYPNDDTAQHGIGEQGDYNGGTFKKNKSSGSGVVKLRGLPYDSNVDDIIAFFEDSTIDMPPVLADQVHIVMNNGRHSGQCYVEFDDRTLVDKAMLKNRHMMGPRYIEIFESDYNELEYMQRRRQY